MLGEYHPYHIYPKILYASILDDFLDLPYFQIVHGIGNILVYFHQLMGEPNDIFSVIIYLSIYLDMINVPCVRKTCWRIKGTRTCCCW